jgi:hypothetical protein
MCQAQRRPTSATCDAYDSSLAPLACSLKTGGYREVEQRRPARNWLLFAGSSLNKAKRVFDRGQSIGCSSA